MELSRYMRQLLYFDIFGAVATSEISFNRLKAGMKAFGHLCSVWRSKTARVEKRAVAIWEMTFYRLKVEI
jgi:hypothetical protein